MSVQAITCALALRGVSASEKLLLLALANYADEHMRCWPSQARLAGDTCLSDRTVRSLLSGLEERRLISRTEQRRRDGSRSSDMITLHFSGEVTQQAEIISGGPDQISGGAEIISGGVRKPLPGGAEMVSGLTTFEPSVEPSKEPVSASPRGSRIKADWLPTEDGLSFAVGQGMGGVEIEREIDRFRDYWLAQPGARGVKQDWPATWRNWVRKAVSDRSRHRPAGRERRQAFV